ncbi:MAG TPA: nucleotide sugar dehydrogenase [Ignavibacteriaceae bacterium]|nr:nucleotide sugar dehydrogenase [Ignavibacteriaceae bacterium]
MQINEVIIGVIGLGYVGLPLARLFATKYPVIGYDINQNRIDKLRLGIDETLEVTQNELENVLIDHSDIFNFISKDQQYSKGLFITNDIEELKICNFYIVTVPTPVDRNNQPDLKPLIRASETVGKVISKDNIVVYESTVYPGATEEDCIPVVANISGLTYNVDFFAGYSPERINPGDKEHTVDKIKKVTSGSTPEVAEIIDSVYHSVITAGTHKASSIKVAEAAKVIENSQRDINIAFVNELAKIFNLMGIDTHEVLEAAGTKWNFMSFKPGLVGGHCIGVDPYYLAQKAQEVGYHPEIILAGRRVNDGMGKYIAGEVVKQIINNGTCVKNARVLMLGITFKENCPDIRNTKVTDIYDELKSYGLQVDIYDPWAKPTEVLKEYKINILTQYPEDNGYSAIVLAVSHNEFKKINLQDHKNNGCIIYDVKGILDKSLVNKRL